MKIDDLVYGEYEICEPVLLDLMATPEMERLKGVSQYGMPDKYFDKKNFSRYEHCIGVMLLLRSLGAPLAEQVSGLLHDVSQFSFSHVSDWIFGDAANGNESYHDTQHHAYVLRSGIPTILKKYGFDVEDILDEDNYSLLENSIPDICADRVDYTLRELAHEGDIDLAREIFSGIGTHDKGMVFEDQKKAGLLAEAFLHLQVTNWGSEKSAMRYSLFSKAFKIAVEEGLVSHDDFWDKSETELLDILLSSGNQDILTFLKRVELRDFSERSGERVKKKLRYVDPFVKTSKGLIRYSAIDSEFKNKLEQEKQNNAVGYIV